MKTTSERLKEFLEHPFFTKKSLGQNFLVSDHVVEKILQKSKQFAPKNVIEIGPGPGALTDHLITWGIDYKALELDQRLVEYWKSKDVSVVEGDALAWDWSSFLSSEVIANQSLLVSNLPYQISSRVVVDRSLDQFQLAGMVLMFQKEVAQRIRALPKSDDYGLLSHVAQSFWKIETVCEAGPRDFNPAPRVASRVLAFQKKPTAIQNKADYFAFLKQAWSRRRKQLKNNMASDGFFQGERLVRFEQLLEKNNQLQVRIEELSIQQVEDLYFGMGFK